MTLLTTRCYGEWHVRRKCSYYLQCGHKYFLPVFTPPAEVFVCYSMQTEKLYKAIYFIVYYCFCFLPFLVIYYYPFPVLKFTFVEIKETLILPSEGINTQLAISITRFYTKSHLINTRFLSTDICDGFELRLVAIRSLY